MEQRKQRREINSITKENCLRPSVWKVVGGTALALAIACVIVNMPDIKRYIRISTM